ncbi:hypothetical protein EJ05DRAFT_495460 [Pseudovirgaria hyperparasitica]|uniref:Hydrophobin n=1 Tax=Pseudovirgaria hyperparasitica TaxID=470096 RepID=A0A6A6WK90_9PEZI|nr:uncharacterized protein EJ05DRAFT_495460 [Pseudovirgaria hyperparasitica]KAF2762584.1 hypothetical protein EJ05DRAFT_495460 [Pseudovirgaria hyperparasitica]
MYKSTFITLLAAIATSVTAAPTQNSPRQFDLCANLLDSSPLCCEASVGGVLNLTCDPPSSTPSSIEDFESICAASGTVAYCCAAPLLGDALSCSAPTAG